MEATGNVFDFGIDGYRPHWLQGGRAVTAAHAERLRRLVGRPLTRSWLVWDLQDDEWFPDCPVVLDFDGERVEINHQKFDDLSLTWNSFDPERSPVRWYGFELAWRADPLPQLLDLRGQMVDSVELVEWFDEKAGRGGAGGETGGRGVDIGFGLAHGWLTVFNALDENGLAFAPPDPSHYRRQPLLRPGD